jgi:zinc/manganese transport system ATP-binding protein
MGGQVLRGPGEARVAYLPQQADIDRSFPVSVLDTVAMGLWHEVGAWRPLGRARRERCREALAQVGLEGFEKRTLDTLSGGQFQRVLFARLMLRDAALILLDEPFAAVDEPTAHQLLERIDQWHREGRTVIAVLHDLAMVRERFPQTLLLAREPIACGATAEVLSPANLARASGLVEAFDEHAAPCDAGAQPPGQAIAGAPMPVLEVRLSGASPVAGGHVHAGPGAAHAHHAHPGRPKHVH